MATGKCHFAFRGPALALLQKAFEIGQTDAEQRPVVCQRITAKDL